MDLQTFLTKTYRWYRGLITNTGLVGKLLLLGLPFLCVCMICTVIGSALSPRSNPTLTQDLSPRSVQRTAEAISTENARAIEEMTRTAAVTSVGPTTDVRPTMTLFANQVLQTQTQEAKAPTTQPPITATPRFTPTIFYIVITNTPAPPRPPATSVPGTRVPATRTPTMFAPTVSSGGGGGNFEGPVGVCTTGCSVSTPPAGCVIKGNVNSSKEKIYHTPGQRDYERTQIKPEEGDAWFCTQAEAEAAGFRHAQR